MSRLATFVLRRSRLVILAFAILTAVFLLSARRVTTNNATEALYPDHSVIAELDDEIQATFGQHDRLLVVVEGDVFTPTALETVHRLTQDLRTIDGAVDVTSIATAKRFDDDDGFLVVDDLVPAGTPTEADVDAARAYLQTSPMYQNATLVTADGRYASLVVEHESGIDAAAFARAVDAAVDRSWDGPYALAGQAFTSMELQSIIGRDLPILGATALAIIFLLLFVNFRSWHGTLLPFVQIFLGVIWGMGAFHLLGHELMALTVIGPIAVMAVASSFSLHLLGRFFYELSHRRDWQTSKQDAIRAMIQETGLGVTISGLAIAAAMSTFLLSDLAMVRGLGLVAALGVLSSLLASMLLLPALLNVLPTPRHVADPEAPGAIGAFLRRLAGWLARRRVGVLLGAAVIVAVGVIGTLRIVPNTSILAFFPERGPTRTSVATVEKVVGGSSVITAWVDGDMTDPAVLAALERFQASVAKLDGVGSSQSIANVLRALHLTLTGEDALPPTRQAAAQELLLYQSSGDVQDLLRFVTLDYQQALVTMSATSMSTARIDELEEELAAAAKESFGDLATVRFAGQPLLEHEIEDAMRHDFLLSLTLAIALVITIDSFVRSFRAAAVTILALLATVALQYGLLGWLGIPLNLATMLMGALAIGVGDYAIHLTVRYMEERRRGLEPEPAIEHALVTSGRQIVFTALTLGGGFAALTFADFVPVATLGGLMVLTVGLVGLATLTLLPATALTVLRNPLARVHAPSEAPTHAD